MIQSILLTTLLISASAAQRREGGLGASHEHEAVSSSPLTFTADAPPAQPPRELLDGREFERTADSDAAEEDRGEDRDGEGGEMVGEPRVVNEPIARRLRRLVDYPVVVVEDEESDDVDDVEEDFLPEDPGFFVDESAPIFDPELDENGEFELLPYAEAEYREELLAADFYEDEEAVPNSEDGDSGDGDRFLTTSSCGSRQKRAKIEIQTDNRGSQTRWEIRKSSGGVVIRGPPSGQKYSNSKTYVGGICLNAGTYKFIVFDSNGNGMCGGGTGNGLYRFYLSGSKKFTSPSNCNQAWKQRVHSFNVQNSSGNNNNNNSNQAITNSVKSGCSNVKIMFKVDEFGKETNVLLQRNGGGIQLQSNKEVGQYKTKTMTKCVAPGTYTFKLIDTDGICCSHGKGWYKLWVNNQQIVSGAYFVGQKSHTIKLGLNWQSSMSARDKEWLSAHNSRRRKYNGGKGFVPLRWSSSLEKQAKQYAEQLGNNCKNGQLKHAGGLQDGENLAKNKGTGSWGNLPSANNVMTRWVDNELTWAYPKNAHYTQVVWRATQYVGCGESHRSYGSNEHCRVQVCRFTRAGNCNVKNGNWRGEAWKDDTGCGRACPNEGCFA